MFHTKNTVLQNFRGFSKTSWKKRETVVGLGEKKKAIHKGTNAFCF